MAVSIVIDITQNSQSIADNTSNVTVKVNAKWTGGSYNTLQKSGSCTIDGTKYEFTSPFNTGQTTSGSGNLFTKTLNIKHADNGTKTLAVSASYTSGVSSGTVAASASKVLTPISRKSTLSVAVGTLGTSQTLTVTRQSTSFTHSIKAVCGSSTLYIKADGTTQTSEVKHNDCSIPFTPPLSWASQSTKDTSLSVKFTITTYNGSSKVGENSYSTLFAIPASVIPSCTVTVTDAMGYKDIYGAYIQNKSKFKVTITPTLAYGSPIKAYESATTAAGENKYTTASYETGLISQAGSNHRVYACVTDARGRKSDFVFVNNLNVLPYSPPKISQLTLQRQGEQIQARFSASVTALNNSNNVSYKIECKETSVLSWNDSTPYEITALANVYEVENAEYTLSVNSSKSYDIRLTVADDFSEIVKIFTLSTKAAFISQGKEGTGIAFGKEVELGAEESLGGVGVADFGFDAKFNSPVYGKVEGLDKLPYIPNGSNLNDYLTTGCWAIYSNSSENQPSRADMIYSGDKLLGTDDTVPPARAGRFVVVSATGEGIRAEQYSYLRQKFYPYNSSNAVWEREMPASRCL